VDGWIERLRDRRWGGWGEREEGGRGWGVGEGIVRVDIGEVERVGEGVVEECGEEMVLD
jgi:hypothetical protein